MSSSWRPRSWNWLFWILLCCPIGLSVSFGSPFGIGKWGGAGVVLDVDLAVAPVALGVTLWLSVFGFGRKFCSVLRPGNRLVIVAMTVQA